MVLGTVLRIVTRQEVVVVGASKLFTGVGEGTRFLMVFGTVLRIVTRQEVAVVGASKLFVSENDFSCSVDRMIAFPPDPGYDVIAFLRSSCSRYANEERRGRRISFPRSSRYILGTARIETWQEVGVVGASKLFVSENAFSCR